MGESLDIIAKLDTDEQFGPTNQILPSTGRTDIKAWVEYYSSVRKSIILLFEVINFHL